MNTICKIFVLLVYGFIWELCTGIRWRRDAGDRWNGTRTQVRFPWRFISVYDNAHGEKELRIAYGNIISMETYMKSEFSSEFDVAIRQVTDGQRIVNGVYQGGHLKECDISEVQAEIELFNTTFKKHTLDSSKEQFGDVFAAYMSGNVSQRNITVAYLSVNGSSDLQDFVDYVNMTSFENKCRDLLEMARRLLEVEAKNNKIYNVYEKYITPSDSNKSKTRILNDDKNLRNIIQERSTEPIKRSRSKRSSFDFKGVLIFPGTKWCGKGDLAACYEDLGDDKDLDSCCRDHDCCPYVIPPFTSRFNIFNYRLYSLLHCDCDQRFRGCLRSSLSSMANMIGKIYFNVLGSKCFEFEKIDICVERSWYGRCKRYEKQETAVIKSQVSFLDANCDGNQTENDVH